MRRAADAVRLIVSGAVLIATVLVAVATRSFARRIQHGLVTAVVALPVGVRDVLVAVVHGRAVVVAVLVYRLISFWLNIPVGAIALQVVQRRGYV